jgi:Mrp family chromosome partitioning ATPase
MVQNSVNEFQILYKALTYLRTHWWLFILEVVAIYALAVHNFSKSPPVFDSHARILIDSQRRQLYQALIPGLSSNTLARKQNLANLLTSAEMMERFRTALTEFYSNEGRPPHLRPYFPGGTALPAERFRAWVNLNYDKNSDIYNINCNSQIGQSAHDLCLVYMNTIESYYPEIGQRDAMMKREFLSRQISSFIAQIKEREKQIVEFQQSNEEFFNYIVQSVEEKGLQRLRLKRNNMIQKLATNRAIRSLMLEVPRAKRGELTARTASITALTQKVSDLQYQLELVESSESAESTETKQRAQSIKSQLSDAAEQLAKLNEDDVNAYIKTPLPAADVRKKVAELELEYRTSQILLQNLEKQIDTLQSKERKFGQMKLDYERMLTELSHRKKLITNLYQREQETEVELAAGNSEIFRLMEPSLPGHRTSPQLSKYMYGAMSASLFVLAITTVLLMAIFPRLDSEAEVHRLNLPVLGKVPLVRRFRNVQDEIPGYGLEHLKIMIYRIVRETKDLKCPVVVISSPHAREGKSTLTHFLSMASQNPDRKTLLIDGDLLTAHPNKFFGFSEDATKGLGSYLQNQTALSDWRSLILKTEYEGIEFMPRGGRLETVALPHFLKPMELLLKELRSQYDMIFIDTPPLFASNLAHQWAGLGDLIILVARIFSTRPKDIQEAIQTCKVFSKAPVGIALNCVRLSGANKRASNYYFSKKKAIPPRLAA